MNGLPLLSHTPPDNSDGTTIETACRRCNKDFNFLFARQKRCNHCGYAYCSSCADFQALMPRPGPDMGYDTCPVCAYCVDMLTVTASSKNKLRSLPLTNLRAYMKAYNIVADNGALEKDDLVEAMIRARGPNGCLLSAHETYYRNNSVPKKSVERQRSRNFFSRASRPPTPPLVPPPPPRPPQPDPPPPHERRGQARPEQPRADAYQMPSPQSQSHYENPRYPQGPPDLPPPQYFHLSQQTNNFGPSASQTEFRTRQSSSYSRTRSPPSPPSSPPSPPSPPLRPRSAAPAVPATHAYPPQAVPSLDSLLDKGPEEISHLSISTLKAVLFENRVKLSTGVLEKGDLVLKVLALMKDERKDRETSARQEQEEAERMEWARKEREKHEQDRKAEERERNLTEERLRDGSAEEASEQSAVDEPTPSPISTMPNSFHVGEVQGGLCVICCYAQANMAIIDCGHLSMCKDCSDSVMETTRECPLCRTRIVTEQRLLRIFKS